MSPEFVRCEFCKVDIPSKPCKLAVYRTEIDGKEYVFCCENCAERYKQNRQKTK